LLAFFTQKELFFWVNEHYATFLDYIAQPVTDIGDGLFCTIFGIFLLLFVKVRHGLALLLACALEGIIIQVLKLYIFIDKPRPWAFYKATEQMHLVKDFIPYSNNSFPSGHTATAFCMAAILTLIWPKAKMGWLFLIIALAIAYSRIYLSQHYFFDIYVGSIIGVSSAILIYIFIYGSDQNKFKRLHKLDVPLIRLKR